MKDCATQADREFKNLGYNRSDSKTIGGYTNHYSEAKSMCFMLVSSTTVGPENIFTSNSLSDAFEGKEFGSYMSNLRTKAPDAGAHLVDCYVLSAGGEKQLCQSEDQFKELVKPYMETADAAPAK